MTSVGKVVASQRLSGAVLSADVDWQRGRIASVVDGAPGLPLLEIAGDTLVAAGDIGASQPVPDGLAATDVILHPSEDVAISVGWERAIRVWSLQSGALVREIGEPKPAGARPGRSGFWGAVLSTCGRYLDTHDLSLCRGRRFVWSTGLEVGERWADDGPLARHPDADLLGMAVGADASVAYFAAWNDAEAHWAPVAINLWIPCRLAFGPRSLAAVGGTSQIHAIVFDFPSLSPRFSIKSDFVDEDTAAEFGVSQAAAWSPDARTLYIAGGSGEIVALDATDGHERGRWQAHDGMVTRLLHHPNEPRLLSTALDGCVAVHETTTEARVDGATDVTEFLRRYPPLDVDPVTAGDDRVDYLDAP